MMSALLTSAVTVLMSEIGDKTQLLSLFLAARFSKKYAIIAGILTATLLNHFVSALCGVWIAKYLSPDIMKWVVGVSFILVGLWLLKPDKEDELNQSYMRHGAYVASFLLFFLAEIGDKTQIATVVLAANYHSVWLVLCGSTLGMLLADVPVVFLGAWIMKRLPLKTVRYAACVLFCLLGLASIFLYK